ncbi:MAG: DsbA family protein, partial [Novosphingobium sp.]
MDTVTAPSRLRKFGLPLLFAVLGVLAGVWWQAHRTATNPAGGMASGERAAIESVVHDYLLEHPEVLPKAMENLAHKQNAAQLAGIRSELESPWPGEVLGNPKGKVTLVEFTDFACTYCRRSVEDVEALIGANPDLRVVVRQLPILSPESADAARMGMAAAAQGKYAAFHKAMFAAGRPDAQSIQAAAQVAGVDLARASKVISDPLTEQALARNIDYARQLGLNGTPSWVIGDALLSGAVGREKLAEA